MSCARANVWPHLLSIVKAGPGLGAALSIEEPWRLSYQLDLEQLPLTFGQGTFLVRDDGDECHVAWGIVFDPAPVDAAPAMELCRQMQSALASLATLVES